MAKGTKDAKGTRDPDDDGLFIAAENDTPQMMEKLLVKQVDFIWGALATMHRRSYGEGGCGGAFSFGVAGRARV